MSTGNIDINASGINSEDTSTWLPLDGLEAGFDANRAPHSHALAGAVYTVRLGDGTRIRHELGASTVRWEFVSSGESRESGQSRESGESGEPGESGEDAYEAFEVDTGLYYVQFQHTRLPKQAVSLVLDLRAGHAVTVLSTIGAETQRPTVLTQRFDVGTIEGISPRGPAPAPSTDLLGRRMLWTYSETHRYEHIYLTERWYTFHCLSGPEAGLADTDACTYYRLRPGIYLFAWREKVVPCAAVTVADHRDFRSHGALFGLDEDRTGTVHFTFGAYGRLLSNTVYPDS